MQLSDLNQIYRDHTAKMLSEQDEKTALETMVGGHFDTVGPQLADLLQRHGMTEQMAVVDFGCGSGRVGTHLGKRMPGLDYTGIDVVPEAVDYAKKITPPTFKYILNETLTFPLPDQSADMMFAFSVFTHLYLEQTYLYLRDAKRVLKPGGVFIGSFLDATTHWPTFEWSTGCVERNERIPINIFTDRQTILKMGETLGYRVAFEEFGQTAAIFRT